MRGSMPEAACLRQHRGSMPESTSLYDAGRSSMVCL